MFQQPAVSSLAANKADFSLAWEMLWFNNRICRKYEDGLRNYEDGSWNYEDGSWNYGDGLRNMQGLGDVPRNVQGIGDGLQNLQGIIEAGKTVC